MLPHSPDGPSSVDRLAAGVACAGLAVDLYEHLQPADQRLRTILALISPLLSGTGEESAPRRVLDAALQTACDCSLEATSPVAAVAADALAALVTAALTQADDQPRSLTELFASLTCAHAQAALMQAMEEAPSTGDHGLIRAAVAASLASFEAALQAWPVPPTRGWAPSPFAEDEDPGS